MSEHDDLRGILSDRETQVLDLLALGLSNREIAARLHVTVHAVKFHLAGIYRKLGAANRTEAVVCWLSAGAAGAAGAVEGPRTARWISA